MVKALRGGQTAVATGSRSQASEAEAGIDSRRETIESIVVAVVLAFLFRGFVAEAFVIPTGSMAPTLRGRHMDVVCPQCRYQYMTGASMENRESGQVQGEVRQTTCPICHFPLELEKDRYPNDRSFNGDRILVSKFAYQVGEPQRWDVIVFKYPGNAKQNYIKRLVGLPGEHLRIRHGDVYALEEVDGRTQARILRKDPSRLRSMLQLVDDTNHVAPALIAAQCPSRWQQSSAVPTAQQWEASEDLRRYAVTAGPSTSWLRYRHLAPLRHEWADIERGVTPPRLQKIPGELITDHYSYNDSSSYGDDRGTVWVGDLAVECLANIQSDAGELLLDLVEGGTHYECRIDVGSGQARLTIRDFDGQPGHFVDAAGTPVAADPTGSTPIRGRGKHRLRFSNCDDELLLWVDEKLVQFDQPTTYISPPDVAPQWSPRDPGDIAPVGIGAQNASVEVTRLRVLRDIYYLAHRPIMTSAYDQSEYDLPGGEYQFAELRSAPEKWADSKLFQSRRAIEFKLDQDQFFPLGDNSPQSKDARLWYEGPDLPPYVKRELLIGKALLVYWPHGWRPIWPWLSNLTFNVSFIPNFSQMKLIR